MEKITNPNITESMPEYKLITNKSVARQSNILVDSKYKIALPGSFDLLFKLIAEIDKDDIEFGSYMFNLRHLEGILGKRISQEQIRNIGKELTNCKIEISKPNGDYSIGSWFSFFEFYAETNNIKLSFHQNLKPYLLQLKTDYTKYNIKYVIDLSSGYSKRLYTILKSKEYYSHDYKIKIEDINLKLFGESKDIEFKEVNRLIKKCVTEINKKTDIYVEYQTHKARGLNERKKTTHISFSVIKNPASLVNLGVDVVIDAQKNVEDMVGQRVFLEDKYVDLVNVSPGRSGSNYRMISFIMDGDTASITREYQLKELEGYFFK
jgi:plasmid replication initiation protein